MYRCGITGATGVVGRSLIKNLKFKFVKYKGRIQNKNELENWLKKNNFDLIFHLAAIVPTNKVKKNYKKALEVNYFGTKNLVDIINKIEKKPSWFFFSSTSHVYNPINKKSLSEKLTLKPYSKYGYTKLLAEKYIRKKLRINNAIGRIFSFTDKQQSNDYLIPSLANNIKKKKIELKNLNHYRDFIHIKDICAAIKILWEKKANGIFNIGSGKMVHLKNLALLINKNIGKKKTLIFFDNQNVTFLISNINKIKKLGWKPKRNLNKIIRDYLN